MAGILTKLWSFPQIIFQWLSNHVAELLNDNLWQKMLKNVLSTAITITIGVIPAVVSVYGKSTFLGAMAASFGQPGQRFGQKLVFFFMLINLSILTGAAKEVALAAVKAVIYPIFTAIGVMVLVNVLVFPQFSSGFLGKTTVDTLKEVITSFQTAGSWFVTDSTSGKGKEGGETSSQSQRTKLVSLTDEKAKLRTCLASCKAAQAECDL
ncbi:hypothetical protein GGR57DRAFT_496987 [Xylariaceae sp. FL1272]|nr:hypothetical protein GGR57DRAFT_496987 [Xylariaceae sp. FL1272]